MSNKHGLTGRKQSYKSIRRTFVGTEYGNVSLELAVGQAKVIIINDNIKGTLLTGEVRDHDNVFIAACRKLDDKKFSAFCDELDALA